MQRRDFIKKAGLGLATAAGTAAVPALADSRIQHTHPYVSN